ncbi:MAG TPA: YicC family protein [Enterococcus columbae]|nr:YicC family protein [Enterococcus columbae]
MKSMTGFGKAVLEEAGYRVTVEMKSVNNRFLDVQLRLPSMLNEFELMIRKQIANVLQRGRVEVMLKLDLPDNQAQEVKIHWASLKQAMDLLNDKMRGDYRTSLSMTHLVEKLILRPEFIEVQSASLSAEQLAPLMSRAVLEAVTKLDQVRLQEGEAIAKVLQQNGQMVAEICQELASFNTLYEKEYQERYEKKLQEYLAAEVQQERLLTELAILLERGDIHEELDRLAIHCQHYQELLVKNEPIGRQLDFLLQEMNREVNTIGSKSSAIEIKNYVIQLKTTLEKIREQIQNIE